MTHEDNYRALVNRARDLYQAAYDCDQRGLEKEAILLHDESHVKLLEAEAYHDLHIAVPF